MVYLNHAGTSWPKPPLVATAANGVFHSSPVRWPDLFVESHLAVASFFHVDASRLLLTPSCTAALQLAVQDHPWQAGDRVLTSHFEHHAMQRSLLKLQEQGVKLTVLPYSDDEPVMLDALEAELRRGQLRKMAMTAACNVTGRLLPIAEAIALAQQAGARTLIDGAQIAGWWDLNIDALQADMFTFAGHKGPQAPWGVGGLYVRPGLPMQCPLAGCDTTVREPATADMPGYCDAGSVNLAALAGLSAGCQWLNQPAQQHRLKTARELTAAFTQAVRNLPRVTVHHDVPVQHKMPTIAISIAGCTSTDLAQEFRERGLIISAGFQCAPQAHIALGTTTSGVLRFSFGPSSTIEDVGNAVQTLNEVLSLPETS